MNSIYIYIYRPIPQSNPSEAQELGGGKVRVASKSLLAFGIVVYTWWQLGRMAGPNVGRHALHAAGAQVVFVAKLSRFGFVIGPLFNPDMKGLLDRTISGFGD